MRIAIVVAVLLGACYSPDLQRCRVTCANGESCPGAQACLADGFCHTPDDEQMCDPDARPPDASYDADPDAMPDAMPPIEVTTISAGGDFACVIDANTRLICWGLNVVGQVGVDPSMVHVPSPTDVGGGPGWSAMDAGDDHVCAIKGGEMYCWGSNQSGECGTGGPSLVVGPTLVPAWGTGWISVSAGARYTCGIRDDGAGARHLYCWGSAAQGQLGNGSTTTVTGMLYAVDDATDGAHADWKQVVAGVYHTCAVRDGGEAYCWGDNGLDQLGIGASGGSAMAPTPVVASSDDGQALFDSIAPYYSATCGVGTNGSLYCWGDNSYKQLGNPSLVRVNVPRRVGTGTDWAQVALGYLHACGARADHVECWGDGDRGAMGNGQWDEEPFPTTVTGLGANARVTVGWDFACASVPGAGAWCWGDNTDGQLGLGVTSTKHAPALIAPSDGLWTKVRAGEYHTCGVHDGELLCWGWNVDGQLAFPASEGSRVPTTVPGISGAVSEVAVGEYHTCALVDAGGGAHPWCWGDNAVGQVGVMPTGIRSPTEVSTVGFWHDLVASGRATCALQGTARSCWGLGQGYGFGNSSESNVLTPTAVSDGGAWAAHSYGIQAGCGVQNNLSMWCWGIDSTGQQGNGATTGSQMIPHEVDNPATYSRIAMAWEGAHVCGITGGTLKCWGRNDYGQCGVDTDGVNIDTPTSVAGAGTWTEVATAIEHSCGIKDGALYCWGKNDFDAVGIDTILVAETPMQVGTDTGWTQVTAGFEHTCAIRDGNVYCWGDNVHGQIGDGTANENTPQAVTLPAS